MILYVGRLKEVPGVFSHGESLDELEENIRDAYRLIVESWQKARPIRKSKKREEGTCTSALGNQEQSLRTNQKAAWAQI
jgi:predicted RNase H-like HicB family nuclease